MSQLPTDNRRRDPRVAISRPLEAVVRSDSGTEYIFRTRDISARGLFLSTATARSYPLRRGTSVDIEVITRPDPLRCRAVIARVVTAQESQDVSSPAGFGCEIVEIDEHSRVILEALLTT